MTAAKGTFQTVAVQVEIREVQRRPFWWQCACTHQGPFYHCKLCTSGQTHLLEEKPLPLIAMQFSGILHHAHSFWLEQ